MIIFKNCYLSESEAEANWSVKNLIGNNLVNELPIFEQKSHRNNVWTASCLVLIFGHWSDPPGNDSLVTFYEDKIILSSHLHDGHDAGADGVSLPPRQFRARIRAALQ